MNALTIKLTGKVTTSNFDDWKTDLLAQIASSRQDLQTDDDFADAEHAVKAIKSGELTLKNAKISALEQAAEIQKLFAAIDEVSEEARQARLSLERQIKARKAEIRDETIDNGLADIEAFLDTQSDIFQSVNRQLFASRQLLESATKGKRTSKSLKKAISDVVVSVKQQISNKADCIKINEITLSAVDNKLQSLFQDKSTLLDMSATELNTTIEKRIAYHREEQARLKADAIESVEVIAQETEEKVIQPCVEDQLDSDSSFTASIELFTEKSRAMEFIDELEGRYSHRDMIGEIRLYPS